MQVEPISPITLNDRPYYFDLVLTSRGAVWTLSKSMPETFIQRRTGEVMLLTPNQMVLIKNNASYERDQRKIWLILRLTLTSPHHNHTRCLTTNRGAAQPITLS